MAHAAAWEALCRRADDIGQPADPRGRGARLADALVESITGIPAANDPRRRPDTPTTPDNDGVDNAEATDVASAPAAEPAATPVVRIPGDAVEIHVVVLASQLSARPGTAAEEPAAVVLPFGNRAARRAGPRQSEAPRGRRLGSSIWAVIGLDSLLGQADVPAEIHTFGAVPAAVVRRMAQGRVILRRLVIDDAGRLLDAELTLPLTAGSALDADVRELMLTAPYRQHPLDYGASVYRLPADLDRHIVMRDRTCTVPGCGRPALRCDGEHAIPWPRGSTSEANCGAMCRWHHRLKTHAGWTIHRRPDGTVLWTSPEGLARRRRPFDYTRYLS